PIWKPHGVGLRFPWQYSTAAQADARKYGELRMSLLPYTYTFAYQAAESGAPIARPMLMQHPDDATAWATDQQYYWGDQLVVVPNPSDGDSNVQVWLPKGNWYDYWWEVKHSGP